MDQFIARQPIFDKKQNVVAYELFFRSGVENCFQEQDGDKATCKVIANSLLLFGMENMTRGSKAFINFTRELLVNDYAMFLPKKSVVVEILETVEPDLEVLEACRRIRDIGYDLALDDFAYHPRFHPLLELSNIVKVDFLEADEGKRLFMADAFIPMGLKLLAEKVETLEDYDLAKDMGYSMFQGYFFSKPVIISRRDLPAFKLHYLRMLELINSPSIDLPKLASLISGDVSLTYKMLRYVNSVAFSFRNEITSIEHCLALLGEDEIRQWASLVAMTSLGEDKPAELLVNSAIRGRMAELVAPFMGLGGRKREMFLMGLLSMLDAIMGRPLDELVEGVSLADDVKDALLVGKGRMRGILMLVEALERAEFDRVETLARLLKIDEVALASAHRMAVKWYNDAFGRL